MLKIRETVIDKLPAATPGMKPKPFPGRYPTRLWVAFPKGEVYLGKPSTLLCQRVSRLSVNEFAKLELVEFDRAAKFFGFVEGKVIGCVEYLALYHPGMPFEFGSAARVAWFGVPFRTLRVGKHSFYTTRLKGEDQGMMRFISERLNPPVAKPPVAQLKLTRPKPQAQEYASYTAYNIDYRAWRTENAEYLKQKRLTMESKSLGSFKY